jgi:hypothetical protein
MSHYTKGRAVGYYNDLLIGDDAHFNKLLKRYSICPPSHIGGYYGAKLGEIAVGATSANPTLALSVRANDINKRRIEGNRKIAYVDLRLNQRNQTGAGVEGDMITFDATYAVTPNYVPVYYLPWEDAGASIRLTIPVAAVNKGPSHPLDPADPYLFFTAAINGCSIFFRGTPQHPTIFHCGGSTGRTALNDQAQFWQEVMAEFVQSDDAKLGRQAKLGPLYANSVDKRDYIKNPNVTTTFGAAGGQVNTTANAKSYQGKLRGKHALGKLSVESVNPWGCVLGRRADNGDWTFYLQENATIRYHEISRNPIKLISGFKSTSYAVARPLVYSEIFPNGPAHVTVKAGLPSIL